MATMMLDGVEVPLPDGVAISLAAAFPEPVPASITRRQLILALLAGGFISAAEAEAAATSGAQPAAFAAVLAGLSASDALAARITWATMSVAERSSPLIAALITGGAATDAQVDNLFRVGATL